MGNFHGTADEVRLYLYGLVQLVERIKEAEKQSRLFPGGRWDRRAADARIELDSWLDNHYWLETLPLVQEGPASGG